MQAARHRLPDAVLNRFVPLSPRTLRGRSGQINAWALRREQASHAAVA